MRGRTAAIFLPVKVISSRKLAAFIISFAKVMVQEPDAFFFREA
jgi:hypothetical protein